MDGQEATQQAIPSCQSAVRYYEAALEINLRPLENVRALKQLSYRLGARKRNEIRSNGGLYWWVVFVKTMGN